jgi:SAM-dependent methyltransferase
MRATSAGDVDYEQKGPGYASQRRTDPRIAALVTEALGDAKTIVNVGAGAGSYEPVDRHVIAIEPSKAMRAQRPAHLSPAIDAVAEHLPLDDDSVDAAMAMVTVHQWADPERGLSELRRVARGPVVVLTFDGDALDRYWLADYVPELIAAERRRYPPIAKIREALGGTSVVTTVPVPIDCVDGFTEAYYARPERFLDPAVRRSQSAWGFVPPDVVERAMAGLAADLESGNWAAHYGVWLRRPTFEGSLRLIVARRA